VDPSFKAKDASSYDDVAASYDRLSELYTGHFAAELLSIAKVQPGELVLDLAAGSGIVSRRAAACRVRCIAADLSEGMLRIARSRDADLAAVRMDAERFAFLQERFDAVVSLFGMLHFPDPRSVLKACAEALRPGGRIAFAFGSPAPWPQALMQTPRAAADLCRQRTGLLLKAPAALNRFLESRCPAGSRDTETPLATQLDRAAGRLASLTREVGFADIKTGWIRRRFVVESPESFWELQVVFSSRARKRLAELDPSDVETLRQEFVAAARSVQSRRGALVYDVAAAWVQGGKPGGTVSAGRSSLDMLNYPSGIDSDGGRRKAIR
jgi:SAM-dependent methyltransferase